MEQNSFVHSISLEEDSHLGEKPDTVEMFNMDGTPCETE